jgi:hypothetical protein
MSNVEKLLPLPVHSQDRPLPESGHNPSHSETAWHLLGTAVGWVLLALACTFAVGLVFGFVKAAFQLQTTSGYQLLLVSLAAFAAGAVLIPAAIARGRVIGKGDVRLGLGLYPTTRLPIVIALTIAAAAYAALRNYTLFKLRPELFYQPLRRAFGLSF